MSVVLILLFLCISAWGEYSPNVRNNREIDLFLVRIANRYDISLPNTFYSKPMHTSEILQFLNSVDSLDSAGLLTEQESFRSKNLHKIISGSRNVIRWKMDKWDTENYVNLKLFGQATPQYQEEGDVYLKGAINPSFKGCKGNISYFSEVNVWTEYQTITPYVKHGYQPFNGNAYNLYGRVTTSSIRSSDIFRGGIHYQGKRIDLETAVDYLRQGPAIFYSLTFSGTHSPVTYFRARMDLNALEYTHTIGLLRTQKDKPKYLYTHRLNIPLFKRRVIVGINEVIINGSTAEKAQTDSLKLELYDEERSWEWAYMIPFIPYSFAEHYVGDRDNAILSFDITASLPKNFYWYFEFFIDDISSPFTLFSNDFGNKWALTLGGQYFGLIAGRDLTITTEYSRIEPWVYTHFYGGSHRYTHYGRSLGSDIGPNSAALRFQADYAIGKQNSIGMFIEDIRKDSLSRGGSIRDVFQGYESSSPDSKVKEFLGKGTSRLTKGGIIWHLMPFGLFSLTTEMAYDSDDKFSFDIYGGFSF